MTDKDERHEKVLPKTEINSSSKPAVYVLKEGYCCAGPENASFHADGTITLVKTQINRILVDTGSPWDAKIILEELKNHKLSPDDITYVVGTHGHSDHIGNLNLFQNAIHIVGFDICFGDKYKDHSFKEGKDYPIEDGIVVMPTPGHTLSHVSLVVTGTEKGTIVIAGDLFECEEDREDESLWMDNSEAPTVQRASRDKVLQLADFIIPGHGSMFKVLRERKVP